MAKRKSFLASNGVEIRVRKRDLRMQYRLSASGDHWGNIGERSGFTLDSMVADALREFFLAERDERLGRWRSKLDPNAVVHHYIPEDAVDYVVEVTLEASGTKSIPIDREKARTGVFRMFQIANEWFAEHPAPENTRRPWLDAKEGEVWVLTIDGKEVAYKAYAEGTQVADANGRSVIIDHTRATAGRRIWPEEV